MGAPTTNFVLGYNVFLSRDGGGTWESLATGIPEGPLSWTVNGPATDRARGRVYARDQQGVMEHDTTDGEFTLAADLYPPNPVVDLYVEADATDLILRWNKPEPDLAHGPVEWYRIYQAASPQGPFDEIAEVFGEELRDPHYNHEGARVLYFKVVSGNVAGAFA